MVHVFVIQSPLWETQIQVQALAGSDGHLRSELDGKWKNLSLALTFLLSLILPSSQIEKKNNKKRIFDLQWAVFPPYIFSMNLLKITDTNGFNNFAEKQYLKLFIHLRILTQG